MKKSEDYIYVVLVRALTGLGKFIRIFTKYEYTHIALSLDEKLDDFITFSRKKHFAPFNSGFMHETLDCYAYGKNESIKLKVFKIPVTKANKKKIKDYIKTIENDSDYLFNIYSMVTMPVIHGFRIYKTHNCMSFTSKVLEMTDTVTMGKLYYKYSIKDIDNLLACYKYKEGYFTKTKISNDHYMDKVSIISNIGDFFKLNIKLISRIIGKRGLIEDESNNI